MSSQYDEVDLPRSRQKVCRILWLSPGDEETDLDIGEMIRKSEVAWLNVEEMKAAEPASNPQSDTGAWVQSALSRS
jgi:hypothetical protein